MQPASPARRSLRADLRNVDEATFRHTVTLRVRQELGLVEGYEPALVRCDGRFQRPVELVENRPCLIVVAVVDEGRLTNVAGVFGILDEKAVAGGDVGDVGDVRLRDPRFLIERQSGIHDRACDGLVFAAAEEVEAIAGEAVQAVDMAGCGQCLGLAQQGLSVRLSHRCIHAAVEGDDHAAFGAAIGTAGHDAGSGNALRVGDMELHRHVGAARKA